MLSKVQKYIDSISSTPQLEAPQEACQLFEKERDQWKQERLELLKRIEALETENKQLRDRLALNSQNSSKPPSSDASRKSKSLRKSRGRSRGGFPHDRLNNIVGGQRGHKGHHLALRKGGQAFDYLIRNESSFFAPFSFNQRPDPFHILNSLPKSSQPKAKEAIHEIWQAKTKINAEKAFELFIETYQDKYPKTTLSLQKDRDELLAFYDFPAKHWQSIRTSNPIESTFGTIRHRTKRSKGCLNREGCCT